MEGPTKTVPFLNGDHHNFPRDPLASCDPQNISADADIARTPKDAGGVQAQDPNYGSSIAVEKDIPAGVRIADGAAGLNGADKGRNDVAHEYVEPHAAMASSDDMPEVQQLSGLAASLTPVAARNEMRTSEVHASPVTNGVATRSADEGLKMSDEKGQGPMTSLGSLLGGSVDLQDKPPISNEEPNPHSVTPTGTGGLPTSSNGDAFTSTPDVEPMSLGPSVDADARRPRNLTIETGNKVVPSVLSYSARPGLSQRALSTPGSVRSPLSPHKGDKVGSRPTLKIPETAARSEGTGGRRHSSSGRPLPSPMPTSIPLPPLSIPTYLQLELSSQRPSPLYIHRAANSDFPYESSRVKTERLLNFLVLPFYLESVLWFGTLACVDSWLYTFTILPLRLLKSIYILAKSWCANFMGEVHFVSRFVYSGAGRMWRRRRSSVVPTTIRKPSGSDAAEHKVSQSLSSHTRKPGRQHQRMKSIPSALLPDDKADMLKGLLIICTSLVLLRLDASRMYHWIRGQAAIKLYVIYNLLEVCDRLFSAIGQDVLECLFSKEALERKPDGHSKVLRPFWLFVLALIYTVIHSTALFYQVITLNVAVNSYSNALITLLMSNQFVEIKSTVFKKFEKENLFQLTCADVVERFQLWHMLVIIASRNIVETGGLSAGLTAFTKTTASSPPAPLITNSSIPITTALPPGSVSSILPKSFTLVPAVVQTITTYAPAVSQVLGPFLAVLGSEMLVDWLKHAYINKFNNTRPAIYERFLDVLAKDYYTNAFGDQNLTKRLGLPVIPLSCLLIRASVQTYKMFMAAWVPSSPTSSTSLASIHEHYSSSARGVMPMTTSTAISHTLDEIIAFIPSSLKTSSAVTHITTFLLFLLFFLVLLALKLVLGMLLLSFARSRYRSMKLRERNPIYHVDGGRRVGGWGVVEVDDDKRRWIYDDDPAGHKNVKDREEKDKKSKERGNGVESFEKVKRYEMVAKRIW
ncbi:hypothetical protein A1O7_00523 [Cladophialophora yegresii CBS 114405]|uniref:Cytomegalovirus gH-receptor family protein n=1 Tax=Cladophialophora yegresii CBS 114405 TaxID=1182544 RepID=W9W7W4_9EURO|nr:uncharacterized protein A1O7_00523 [Cladophialophora yegresii CBS 114405]EXJ64187.1 hypothetical protein A1O7_00523 [Cladophialophora yegresii CBS 114405]